MVSHNNWLPEKVYEIVKYSASSRRVSSTLTSLIKLIRKKRRNTKCLLIKNNWDNKTRDSECVYEEGLAMKFDVRKRERFAAGESCTRTATLGIDADTEYIKCDTLTRLQFAYDMLCAIYPPSP